MTDAIRRERQDSELLSHVTARLSLFRAGPAAHTWFAVANWEVHRSIPCGPDILELGPRLGSGSLSFPVASGDLTGALVSAGARLATVAAEFGAQRLELVLKLAPAQTNQLRQRPPLHLRGLGGQIEADCQARLGKARSTEVRVFEEPVSKEDYAAMGVQLGHQFGVPDS